MMNLKLNLRVTSLVQLSGANIIRWFALSASPSTLNFSATNSLTALPTKLNFTTINSGLETITTPVLLNGVNLISLINGTDTDTINASGATSYNVVGLPSFASVDTNTGEVTVTADGTVYGQEKFDIETTNVGGTTVSPDACKIQLFRNQASIGGYLGENAITPTDINSNITTIKSGGLGQTLLYDQPNNYWVLLAKYYTSYGIDNQVKTLNLTTKTEMENFEGSGSIFDGSALNGFGTILAENLNTYLRLKNTLLKYDTVAGSITLEADLPSILGGSILYPSLVLGIDGQLVLGGELGSEISVVEYNTSTGVFTEYPNLNNSENAANRNAAADATYVYQSTNGNSDANGNTYRLFMMDKATKTGVKLANCPNWTTVVQGKYGCWVYIPDGSTKPDGTPLVDSPYWLYNGTMTLATNGLNQDTCPWDNHGEEFVTHDVSPIPKPYIVDEGGLLPNLGTNTGTLWFKRLSTSPWESFTVNNIHTYPIDLKSIVAVPNSNEIISIADDTLGYAVYNTSTLEHNIYSGLMSNYSHLVASNGKLYLSGYPSGMLYEYDPSLPWDNTSTAYDPNTSIEGTNPKFIGYTRYDSPDINGVSIGGTGGGQHKNFVLLEDGDGILWCFGEWERDGTGLGITSVDLNDQYRMVGYRDEAIMSNYVPRRGCITDDYFAILTQTLSGSNTLELVLMNKSTKAFSTIPLPDILVLTYLSTQHGSDIINYGGNKVCISSSNVANDLVLVGVDLDTSTILYENTFTGVYNSKGGGLQRFSDGNIYLGVDGKTVWVEPNNGWIEAVSEYDIYNKGDKAEGNDGNIYLVSGTSTYNMGDNKIPTTFTVIPEGTELIGNPSETGSFVTMVDNGDNTYTLTEDGTGSGYYYIYMTLTANPVNPVDWIFELTLDSGITHLQNIRVGGVDLGQGRDLVIGDNLFQGVTTSPTSTSTKLQMKAYGSPCTYTLTIHSAKERP